MSFTDGGKSYAIEKGCLAKLTITRPSGSKLHEFCAIRGETTAIYPFSQNPSTASEEGIHECEISLYGRDGTQITAPRFTMIVSERVSNMDDNTGITDDHIGIIDSIVQEENVRQAAEEEREASEQERDNAESAREEAESGRVSAEEARVLADENRTAAYKKIEHDTLSSISKILSEQESIMDIQNELILEAERQEMLSAVIALQESYIGGDN
jgi:plasmid stabilization system protein ParE